MNNAQCSYRFFWKAWLVAAVLLGTASCGSMVAAGHCYPKGGGPWCPTGEVYCELSKDGTCNVCTCINEDNPRERFDTGPHGNNN